MSRENLSPEIPGLNLGCLCFLFTSAQIVVHLINCQKQYVVNKRSVKM